MKLTIAAFAFFSLLPAHVLAASGGLRGKIVDRASGAPVASALIRLARMPDTTVVRVGSTREDGGFDFTDLELGAYRLEATRIGYARLERVVRLSRPDQDLGTLPMTIAALTLGEVVVKASPPTALQNADTTEFMARAVKTHPDATAEDLVTKMPGVTVDNTGTVKTNGETVRQVLVDGKPFFGGDPTIALRNLPAEVIEKVQVFDKLSDQAEFSGFDDGQSIKTMNLVLRPDMRNTQVGKGFAGGGDDGRYQVGGNATLLRGPTRLSAIGLANNINQQNFSAQDLLGVLNTASRRGGLFGGAGGRRAGGGRGRGPGGGGPGRGAPGVGTFGVGNFLVGQQDGVTVTRSIGSNYSGTWLRRLDVNQSYFFNDTDNQDTQSLSRQYLVPQDSVALYGQSSTSENANRNHRYEARIQWTADSSNSIIDLPRLYFQSNHSSSTLEGENASAPGALVNRAENDNGGATTGHDLSDHLVVRHRFPRPGRTLSADLGLGHTLKNGTSGLHSLSQYFQGEGSTNDTLDQRTGLRTTTGSLSARLVYTEPFGRMGQLQATFSPAVTWSQSDDRALRLDPASGAFTIPDSTLSNAFKSTSASQSGGIGYRAGRGALRLMVNLAYQRSTLRSERTLPAGRAVDRAFLDPLPSLMLNANLPDHRNLRLSWNTSTRAPSIGQLQDVVDNSNPLVLTTGNPALKQSYNHTFVGRYSTTDPVHSRSFFVFLSVQRTSRSIANASFTAPRDTVLPAGVVLRQGTQLVTPVNLDGSWSASSFATYSRPVGLLKSVLNLNTGVTYTRTPGLVNGSENAAATYALSQGVVLASNISEALDFTLAYTGTYNVVRNTLSTTANGDYYTHVASLKWNLISWKGLVMRHEVSNTLSSGVAGGYAQDVVLWNTSVGEKFLKDRRGDLRLSWADLLNQNRSTSRSVTESYIQDSRNQALPKYVMLTFTYTLR